ncbi:ribonuclease E inhibitor RraB [Rubritalea spongiae]|uniref:Ribonuclease E inhibitor RraB n=3 Tax=Rubritalea spongiae TaxID=430797 RepID=A0ABW5DYH2_9BACT
MNIKTDLESQGYTFVDIYQADRDSEDENPLWYLHVEKIETHSPSSLDARNDELYKLAHKHNISSYDGMDVGPTKQN